MYYGIPYIEHGLWLLDVDSFSDYKFINVNSDKFNTYFQTIYIVHQTLSHCELLDVCSG